MSCYGEKMELQFESFSTPACFPLFWANCESAATKGPVPACSSALTPGPRRLSLSSPDVAAADRRIWDFSTVGKAAVQICLARPLRRVSGERRSAPEGKRKSPQRVRALCMRWAGLCVVVHLPVTTVHVQAVCFSSAPPPPPRRHAAGNKSTLLTCGFALRLHTNGRCICQRKRTDYLDERKKK